MILKRKREREREMWPTFIVCDNTYICYHRFHVSLQTQLTQTLLLRMNGPMETEAATAT